MSERVLDHVGIAVTSLEDSVPLWETLLQAPASKPEIVDSQGVEVVFVGSGSGRVELLAAMRPNSPVAQFLERRGPGIHHVGYRVPDLSAALEEMRREGYALVDESPRVGAHGRKIAFLHPRALKGVLVELVEVPA